MFPVFSTDEFTPLVAPTDVALRPTSAARSKETVFGSCFGIEVMSARLCIERDRYFWRDGLGWTSARLTSESLPDGTARLTLATGKELRSSANWAALVPERSQFYNNSGKASRSLAGFQASLHRASFPMADDPPARRRRVL
jgi:hypothetical protein